MTEMYKPKENDEVEVVLRGKVSDVTGLGRFSVGGPKFAGRNVIFPDCDHVISITKVTPAMPEFSRGDVIKIKGKYDSAEHIAVKQRGGWACSCGIALDNVVLKMRWNDGDVTVLIKDGKPVGQ